MVGSLDETYDKIGKEKERKVMEAKVNSNSTIDVSNPQTGNYILIIKDISLSTIFVRK